MVEPSAGLTAETPKALHSALMSTTIIDRPKNSVMGSGSLLPARSMLSRILSSIVFLAVVFSSITILLSLRKIPYSLCAGGEQTRKAFSVFGAPEQYKISARLPLHQGIKVTYQYYSELKRQSKAV